jgi:hypothetical protein
MDWHEVQHRNNDNHYNDANMTRVVWTLWWITHCQNLWHMGGKCDNEEGNSNWEHLFPMIWDIREGVTSNMLYLILINSRFETKLLIHLLILHLIINIVRGHGRRALYFQQHIMKITNHSREIYKLYLKLWKKSRKMSTCNWLDLETLTNYAQKSPRTPGPKCRYWVPKILALQRWPLDLK